MNKIFFPNNIFSKILSGTLDKTVQNSINLLPSASLTKKLLEDFSTVALIPTSDIITNKELYISGKIGISFEGPLCSSYIFYEKNEDVINGLKLYGDASTMEVIFGKILFKELYNTNVEITLTTDKTNLGNSNYIITGDYNFLESKFKSGISFAEEIVDMISAPFVNYVLASQDRDKLIEVSESIFEKISNISMGDFPIPNELPQESYSFIKENISKVFYSLADQDIEGINQLIRLPFYHGMLKDIIEVNFVQ
jgi:hypothetical protein